MRKWRKENPKKRLAHDRLYKKKYGMNYYERKAFKKAQGACAICNDTTYDNLVIDHCHKTGSVRGVLCRKHNLALGLFADDVTLLKKMVEYLARAQQNL